MNELEPHQLRVVAEKADLDEKLAKLATFLASEAAVSLEPEENYLLRIQFQAMNTYSEVLGQRIDRFSQAPAHHPV